MEEITSVNNQLVKETHKLQQKKYRDNTNLFLLEGYKAIKEAFDAGIELKYAFVEKNKVNKYSFLNDRAIPTTEAVLSKVSTTDSAPEAVGVGLQKHFSIKELRNAKRLILLENIRDLGNLGTILRSAVAFGADGVILYGDCADLYNPKCVRSAVGNLWKIPVVQLNKLDGEFNSWQRIATLPRAKTLLKEFKPKDKLLIMFGSEADGLSEDLINYATDSVKIEMSEKVESLNLSISCAITMYELFK